MNQMAIFNKWVWNVCKLDVEEDELLFDKGMLVFSPNIPTVLNQMSQTGIIDNTLIKSVH